MSDADQRLAALLREDDPPARDPMFRLRVLEAAARRRLQVRLAAVVGAGVATMASILALSPSPAITAEGSPLLPTLCIALATLSTIWGLKHLRRPI